MTYLCREGNVSDFGEWEVNVVYYETIKRDLKRRLVYEYEASLL